MAPTFEFVTMDATDPERVAAFWSAFLEAPVGDSMDDGRFTFIPGSDGMPMLCLHRVPEAKTVKNRLHLDFQVEDLEATTRQVEELGGSWTGAEHALGRARWRTLLDPEGNEFDVTVVE
jgi:predicted enzyme related to lactoylglutathione lyase